MPTLHLTDAEVQILDDIISDDQARALVEDTHPDRTSELQRLRGKVRVQLNKIANRHASKVASR